MFSNIIKATLEREIVGQPRAVNSVVRGLTRIASGLTPRERTWCAFMFVGPTGTGKTRLARSVAQTLHGDEHRLTVADCTPAVNVDPWTAFTLQLAPLFNAPPTGHPSAVQQAPPMSVILIEYLERGLPEIYRPLATALDTGEIVLPYGKRGSLGNCLIFLTSGLCAREILDESPQIGFSASQEEEEEAEQERIYAVCHEQSVKHFGQELMGGLDGLVIFHKLQEQHIAEILDRRVLRLSEWLAPRGFRCELDPSAREFLLERACKDLRTGAREIVRLHRRHLEFPVADLLISGRIPSGGLVFVERKPGEGHLHFTVTEDRKAEESLAIPVL